MMMRDCSSRKGLSLVLAIGLGCALVLSGCGRTLRARGASTSGFLGDYSQLQKGSGEEAQWFYINPRADFSTFDKVLIDPVTIWAKAKSGPTGVSQEDLQRLADSLYGAVYKELSADYAVVQQPGPGVLRIRVAITQAKGSIVVLDLVSTVVPPAVAASTVKYLATGTGLFVGKAAVEAEILDSLSGSRLAAVVDERAGGKSLKGVNDTWDAANASFSYWAEKLRKRLASLRASRP